MLYQCKHSHKFQCTEIENTESVIYNMFPYLWEDDETTLTKQNSFWGTWVAQWVNHLPSAQFRISGSWNQASYQAPCWAGSLLHPFLLPLPPLVFSLSLQIKKIVKRKKTFLSENVLLILKYKLYLILKDFEKFGNFEILNVELSLFFVHQQFLNFTMLG